MADDGFGGSGSTNTSQLQNLVRATNELVQAVNNLSSTSPALAGITTAIDGVTSAIQALPDYTTPIDDNTTAVTSIATAIGAMPNYTTILTAIKDAILDVFPNAGSTASSATAGAISPTNFVGYVNVTLPSGTAIKIPYYNP